MLNKKYTRHNTAYSLWRVNGYQQGFRSVASFGLGGQESTSKPPQAICKPLGASERKMRKLLILVPILILNACIDMYSTHLDLGKTEQYLIPELNKINFHEISLSDSLIVVDDTLIVSDSDTTSNPGRWIKTSVKAEEWVKNKKISYSEFQSLKRLIGETENYRIVKEQATYFFSEGGWIDSNFGKAYSETDPRERIEEFRFDSVQEIDPIDDRERWYEYYAD